ncbi:MAG TPA: PilZ domain-containing protein, partial [Gemmataceae bacterium]|nr:PilZ domain-containing protein [Gemmataceae bacterium]
IGTDRRSAVRRQPTVGTVCRLDPQTGGIGLVWNISTGGVSMLLSNSVDRGATVKGVLATATEQFALPVTVRVTHVAPLQTGDFLVGGQFDRPLRAEEMRHFVPTI